MENPAKGRSLTIVFAKLLRRFGEWLLLVATEYVYVCGLAQRQCKSIEMLLLCDMQEILANTFYSELLPLRRAADSVRTDLLDSVSQQLTSFVAHYRFDNMSK